MACSYWGRLKRLRTIAWHSQMARCYYCGARLQLKDATADHKIPISLGGKTSRENVAAACFGCNQRKASIPYQEFRAMA